MADRPNQGTDVPLTGELDKRHFRNSNKATNPLLLVALSLCTFPVVICGRRAHKIKSDAPPPLHLPHSAPEQPLALRGEKTPRGLETELALRKKLLAGGIRPSQAGRATAVTTHGATPSSFVASPQIAIPRAQQTMRRGDTKAEKNEKTSGLLYQRAPTASEQPKQPAMPRAGKNKRASTKGLQQRASSKQPEQPATPGPSRARRFLTSCTYFAVLVQLACLRKPVATRCRLRARRHRQSPHLGYPPVEATERTRGCRGRAVVRVHFALNCCGQ